MAIVKCNQGHHYDNSKYQSCPICSGEKKCSGSFWNDDNPTSQPLPVDKDKTIGVYKEQRQDNPITGWLVCVQGPERGRDYRLYAGFNRMGRGSDLDIYIGTDEKISRECHCSVVYDYKKNRFLLVPGKGSMTFFPDRETLLEEPKELHLGDRFYIGGSAFEFVPFCREGVSWEEE